MTANTSTSLVTGSNRGIGLELVRQLRARGDVVIAVCRSPSPGLEATGARIERGIDVSSEADVLGLARRLEGTRIDLLVHNAGILERGALAPLAPTPEARLASVDLASIRRQIEVNALGPLALTAALLPNLGEGSKIVFVTSRMGSIADNGSGGMYGYRMSKAALNMAGASLARDLAPRGIAVCLLHPGFIRTELTGGHGNDDPPVAAKGILARADALTAATSGSFWHANGEPLPW